MEVSATTVAAEQPKRAARKKPEPRLRVSSFRCTSADLELCRRKASAQGKSLSAYSVMAMLNRRDRRPCVPEINKAAHALLGRAVGNLNQIAYLCNRVAAEEQRPLKETMADLFGRKADAWLSELSESREELKRLRFALIGVGLIEQDQTLRGLNEAGQAQRDMANILTQETPSEEEAHAGGHSA